MGGIGLIISNNGLTKRSIGLYHPMSQPSGTPMIMARKSPEQAICRLTQMFVGSVAPSGRGSASFVTKVLAIVDRLGRILVIPDFATSSQVKRNRQTVAIE